MYNGYWLPVSQGVSLRDDCPWAKQKSRCSREKERVYFCREGGGEGVVLPL